MYCYPIYLQLYNWNIVFLLFTWISRPSFITDSRAPCSVFEFIPISGLNAFRPRMLFQVLLLPFPVFPTSIRRHCPSGKGFSSRSVRETKHIIHARTHARTSASAIPQRRRATEDDRLKMQQNRILSIESYRWEWEMRDWKCSKAEYLVLRATGGMRDDRLKKQQWRILNAWWLKQTKRKKTKKTKAKTCLSGTL